ncbi:chitobiase/beta-hexosaminidase C-terminal domain-containing protein [Paenibacillus sp. OAS669]|uniref:chitobiase/beta-hexosaminidase C-terminal domain-containing protein n=1 Tax=Paenibacillus sp. OAS669 TaxID=2663821 RepID=UPI001789CD77|nr:chitobiase/beta-hexosaminidase C-terminal domain-containing protein [Paenibacillus sp. OAS669]MBE1442605.1 hypothetical protein [Paenibacillus sp. OAS669]
MKRILAILLIISWLPLLSIHTGEVHASSNTIYKLKPKYLLTDFNFEMIASTITTNDNNFSVVGNFRTDKDMNGTFWSTLDKHSHSSLKYPTNPNFRNVVLEYNYSISGYTERMNSENAPVLTIETNSGQIYYIRLWNYVIDRPLDDWEVGASDYFGTTINFPEGRTPRGASGKSGKIQIDFNNLYAGWAPYQWEPGITIDPETGEEITIDTWVPTSEWEKVPVNDIKSIMWSFVPINYNWQSQDMNYLSDSMEFQVDFTNWEVYGNTFLMNEQPNKPISQVRLCDDYDDIYNLTPERVVSEYGKLGYGGIVNFYVGASHYYDKKFDGSDMAMKTNYPFNKAFKAWYSSYIQQLKANNIGIIHSISMESVDAPPSWWQRTWDNRPGYTMWTPVPRLLSFTNTELQAFYKSYVLELAKMSDEQNIKPMIQLGEPWWWFQENEPEKPPTFYDQATKDLYLAEKGVPIHEFHSSTESVEGHEDMLLWLQARIGIFTHLLRDTVKEAYPDSQFTVLFFTPSVIDKNRVPKMMSIVNFPKEHWKYPELDFFMLEDYDYMIFNEMEKHRQSMTFVQNELNYPVDKIHYFSGFALEDTDQVWSNIDQAVNDGFNQGFKEVYVWAYTQIKRRGWVQPDIIRSTVPTGIYRQPFSVSLSTSDNAQIIYTDDGSDPSLSNGKVFTTPIPITNDTRIKAIKVKNGSFRNVVEFDYYFNRSTYQYNSKNQLTEMQFYRNNKRFKKIFQYDDNGSLIKQAESEVVNMWGNQE